MIIDHQSCYRAIEARDVRFDGKFFTAVKTTGIYCRPICPARTPKSGNVHFYATAAAAQHAGFRPCLRCRPESAPGSNAWNGTSNTVARALKIIELDGLSENDLAGLAVRLGLSSRHLRRLFQQHLGASPIAVVQTRRLLLAKQLIHETQLTMAEVAFASGYGSVRRFNEAFSAKLGCPPSDLRRTNSRSLPAGEIQLSLGFRPPYDWRSMLEFFRVRAIQGVESVDDQCYRRTIHVGGEEGKICVSPSSSTALTLTLELPKLTNLQTIIARVRRVFDLDSDPDAISQHFATCPVLGELSAARPGLRVPGAWDGFELAIRAVLGQQISVAAAVKLAGKLTAGYGTHIATPAHGLTHTFPTPQTLAQADLRTLGMPGARAVALSTIAGVLVSDPNFLAPQCNLSAAVEQFCKVRGIGMWTAQYIALRGLHEPDAFPAGDIGLRRVVAKFLGRDISESELLEYSERWQPWRAYAAQYLWTTP